MNISEAAKRSGISAKMIRYYERIGLIKEAGRSTSNYREYDDGDVHTLRFIHRARRLGFSVAEIAELLSLWSDRGRKSADVKGLAQAHIDELRTKIRELQEMAQTLETLTAACHGDARPDCPILEDLEHVEPVKAPSKVRRGAVEKLG